MLPNFLIIGAYKAGSTSLYQFCKEHPDVYMSTIKETNFLSFDPENPKHLSMTDQFRITTLEQYESLFSNAHGEKAIGEASPSYLHSDLAIDKIKELLPDAKLIVSLRNPVDRAYSAYLMALRLGRTSEDVYSAFRLDASRVRLSFYSDQLSRYLESFGRKQLKIFLFDDLKSDADGVARDLFEFLGVDSDFSPNTAYRHNPGGLPKNRLINQAYNSLRKAHVLRVFLPNRIRKLAVVLRDKNLDRAPPLPRDLRIKWTEIFRSDVLVLQSLIDRDLSSWLDVDRGA
jgi:hypothetical protein